ncbi:hypothetical protein KXS11_09130 [Plantibacter flavus]|uniref:hypothetical protein n=1 Tax=Plantibacter flavus TaxID=150123 RepID=UPI003F1648DD
MGSTTTESRIPNDGRGPLPQGDAARLVAAGFIPVFGSMALLVSQATALNALPLFLIAPVGIAFAAGSIYVGSRRVREPAEWLDDGNLVLRIVGAVLLGLGIVAFMVGALLVPQSTVGLWLLVPVTSALGVWLSLLGAKRLRPEVLATLG